MTVERLLDEMSGPELRRWKLYEQQVAPVWSNWDVAALISTMVGNGLMPRDDGSRWTPDHFRADPRSPEEQAADSARQWSNFAALIEME